MDYIEGSHIITYRVYHKNGFVNQESLNVGCRVGYDEACRYVRNYWNYDYEDRIEILSIEPTQLAIDEYRMKLEREKELEERERRGSDPEVHRYRMMLGERWKRESEQDQIAPNPSHSSSDVSKMTSAKTCTTSNHSSQKNSSESKKSNGWWSSKNGKGWW